jgi:hypothetical protein
MNEGESLRCEMDFPHEPMWCDYHFAERQRSQALQLSRDRNTLLREQNELLMARLDEPDRPRRTRQFTPPPPQVEAKPQIRRRGV